MLRLLAVTAAARLESLPEIPSIQEFVTGYEASGWFGIAAPKDTPAEIVERLNKEINLALADPAIKNRLAVLAVSGSPGSSTEFGNLIAADTQKWVQVIHSANIRPE
jgi:tripartite-type tricarboxylate transporter receptor subunit TctC